MRPFLTEVIARLVVRHAQTTRIDLNDIAEEIGDAAVSHEEVEALIDTLVAKGCSVGGAPSVRELSLLREVLVAARELRTQLARNPTVEEIAESSKQPVFVVRRALENAAAMSRPASSPPRE